MSVKALERALRGTLFVLATLACAQVQGASHLYAAAVPGGAVRVLIVAPQGPWPAGGIRIEDERGAVLVPKLLPDAALAATLDAASQSALTSLARMGAGGTDNRTLLGLLTLRLVSDWDFARAAGAAIELPAGTRPHALVAVLLNADASVAARIGPVAIVQDATPPAASSLHAEASAAGVSLSWQTPAQAEAVPVYAYQVERNSGAVQERLTLHPQLMTLQKNGVANPYMDHAPPLGLTLNYALALVDVLGIAGPATTTSLYSPDFEAGAPPGQLHAQGGRGLITLTWTPISSARSTGLVIERAQLVAGPYELLTPEGLNPKLARFEDHQVQAGANYYYRVRAVTADGTLGASGDPVHAAALAASPLGAPQGLSAEIGSSEVALHWQAVPGASLAGYIIERRASASAPRWARLNTRLLSQTTYLDAIGPSAGGSFEYRVTAVASDEGQSAPSASLKVALKDSTPPPAPRLIASSGAAGEVEIRFAPAEPLAKSAQVLLLRSESAEEEGLVIGAPVAAAAGLIRDTWVEGGQAYWYRLVALDAAGNRSALSEAFKVRVAAATLPLPAAPQAIYAKDPAPQVRLTFAPPPAHVRILVEVARADGTWRILQGPMEGTSAIDTDPPGAQGSYRIVYVADSGGPGRASAAVTAH